MAAVQQESGLENSENYPKFLEYSAIGVTAYQVHSQKIRGYDRTGSSDHPSNL